MIIINSVVADRPVNIIANGRTIGYFGSDGVNLPRRFNPDQGETFHQVFIDTTYTKFKLQDSGRRWICLSDVIMQYDSMNKYSRFYIGCDTPYVFDFYNSWGMDINRHMYQLSTNTEIAFERNTNFMILVRAYGSLNNWFYGDDAVPFMFVRLSCVYPNTPAPGYFMQDGLKLTCTTTGCRQGGSGTLFQPKRAVYLFPSLSTVWKVVGTNDILTKGSGDKLMLNSGSMVLMDDNTQTGNSNWYWAPEHMYGSGETIWLSYSYAGSWKFIPNNENCQ